MTQFKLKGRVAFANNKTIDTFGKWSATIEVSDEDAKKVATDLAALAKEAGVAKENIYGVKKYTPEDGASVWQITAKSGKEVPTFVKDEYGTISKFDQDVPFGSTVGFAINTFMYNGKFGEGVSIGLNKISIIELADNTGVDEEDLFFDEEV